MCKELDTFVEDVKSIYGDNLIGIILYGSRARGDYKEDSDYDVMVLTNLKSFEKEYEETLSKSYYWNVDIHPVVRNIDTFNKWKGSHLFYQSVDKEGVLLYGRK